MVQFVKDLSMPSIYDLSMYYPNILGAKYEPGPGVRFVTLNTFLVSLPNLFPL